MAQSGKVLNEAVSEVIENMKPKPAKPNIFLEVNGLKFENAGNKISRGIAFLIYSDPGVGKTTLATTLPESETLIINTEAGLGPTLGTNHIIFNLKEDLSQLESLYQYLRTVKHPFKYVVVDNISEMEQWIINLLTKSRGKDFTELKEYGDAAYKIREYLHLFRDLVYKDITVVFNAWEMPLEIKNAGGEVVTKAFPKLFKKVSPEICGIVDCVGHLEMYSKTGDRFIRFESSPDAIAKSQLKGLEKFEQADFKIILEKLYKYDYKKEGG